MTPPQNTNEKTIAGIFLAIAISLLFACSLLFLAQKDDWIFVAVAVAIFFGNSAINRFEKLAQPVSRLPLRLETELYGSTLKNGEEVNVHLAVYYPTDEDSPQTLTLIQVQLQRTLNVYLSQVESLSADPYAEIEDVLRKELQPLRRELELHSLTIQVVNIKTSRHSKPANPPGINLRTF